MKKMYFIGALLAISLSSNAQSTTIVISQIYGGGGNAGAPYTNDFIEIHNLSASPVVMNGWSVQYTSAAGPAVAPNNFWLSTPIPNVTLAAGAYYLIKESGGATGAALPTPDVDGSVSGASIGSNGASLPSGIAMSGTNGKVILVSSTTQETSANPTGAQIIDKVGYGTTPTGFEGSGPTGTALTNTTSAQRKSSGNQDTDDNVADFTAGAVAPRNLSRIEFGNISGLKVYPNPVKSNLFITSDSFEAKQVELYDVLGKMVLSTKVTNGSVNVSNLSKGVYVVKVTEEGKTATRKLVIE